MKSADTINIATEQLKKLANTATINIRSKANKSSDSIFEIQLAKESKKFKIEVKNDLRKSHLPFLKEMKLSHEHPLVITNYISENLQEILRDEKINYLDTSGNAFIKADPIFIFIQGQKKKNEQKVKTTRAFSATGLKVVFALLADPEIHTYSYRYIANFSGVALGTVAAIMHDLKDLGYHIEIDENIRKLKRKKDLLNRWIVAYGENLKPKLFKERYRFLNQNTDWKKIKLNNKRSCWGGEPAADLLTNFIRPEEFLLYSDETRAEIMKKYRMIPDPNGNITLNKPFWSSNSYPAWQTMEGMTHPLLTYSDLILTGDSRNKEAAEKIYEKYLSDFT